MKLVRYSPDTSRTLTPKSIEHLISLDAGKRTLDFKKGRFLTDDLYGAASSAHDYCSLTYYPRFRYTFNLAIPSSEHTLYKNDKYELGREPKRDELTRAWPAFGSHGGAHEFILDHSRDIGLGAPEELLDGGAWDAYHYDNVQPYTIDLVQAIANGVFSAVFGGEVPEAVGGKVNDSGGVILAWARDKRWYSISVATKCFGGLWKLKFWGSTWADDEEQRVRRVFDPYTEKLVYGPCIAAVEGTRGFDLCKASAETIRTELERGRTSQRRNTNSVYAGVDDCVKHIMKRLYGISDTLFELGSRKVSLQMVEAN